MTEKIKKPLRCAVYTRKSTDEGLDQDFNSIDAQKESGHAYIASHRPEGWVAVADDYDDPAYSGGNMERPALQRLLRDIENNKIDIVVVYKIDRFTRSLNDFTRLIELFQQHDVAFVSVTQHVNTSDAMGRLMLNILFSFAQFEREQTGERIRDKIRESRKKGYWMGSIPPLGYDVKEKRLIVNKEEAKTIQTIFKRFTEIGSTTELCKQLRAEGVLTKQWTTKDGRFKPGKLIDRGGIYKMLNNRTYLGEARHKESWYKNTHPPIIKQKLWDAVHSILSKNHHARGNHTRAKIHFLLKGMVFGEDGRALTSWSSSKKKSGKRYRYYMSTRENKEYAGASGLPRIPAGELESAVVGQIREILKAPPITQQIATNLEHSKLNLDEARITVALNKIDKIWVNLFPNEQSRIINLLVEKIIVSRTNIEIRLRQNGIEKLALEITDTDKE